MPMPIHEEVKLDAALEALANARGRKTAPHDECMATAVAVLYYRRLIREYLS